MSVTRVSERFWLWQPLPNGRPCDWVQLLSELRWPGVEEIVPGLNAIGIYGSPAPGWEKAFADVLNQPTPRLRLGRSHSVPVCYRLGLDLKLAAEKLQLSPDHLIDLHQSTEYQVATLGFQPGFPYLLGLPDALCGLDRLASPRSRVPKGSVAIARDQAGIYPSESPGGWWLLGRTPLTICDPTQSYFPLEPGDHVRFVAISEEEFKTREGERL